MLSSNKISLRLLESSDLNYLYEWENNPENWEVSGTLLPYSKEVLESFIQNSDKDIYTNKQVRFMICLPNGLPIGTIDLFDFDPYNRRAGVGILIANKAYRNKGLASEALEILKRYCYNVLNLVCLYCNIEESNTPSIRLFTKAGFEKNGVKKNWIRKFDGRFVDVGFYQLIF